MSNDIPDADDVSIPSSVDDQPDEYVAKDELRALVEKWKRKSNPPGERSFAAIPLTERRMYHQLADELEKLIQDE